MTVGRDSPAAPQGGGGDVPPPGSMIAGKFRVGSVLGSGGMGVVVAATHIQLGQKVAIKILRPAALENIDGAARFLREARAAASILSEHGVRITDFGTLPPGLPFIVMEHLDG